MYNIVSHGVRYGNLPSSRESAGKLRHNSHCRDEAADICPRSHASQSEGLPDVISIFLGQMEEKLNSKLEKRSSKRHFCGWDFDFFSYFLRPCKGRFSFTLGGRKMPFYMLFLKLKKKR